MPKYICHVTVVMLTVICRIRTPSAYKVFLSENGQLVTNGVYPDNCNKYMHNIHLAKNVKYR